MRDPPRLRLVACFLSVALEHTIFDRSGRKRQKSFSGSSAEPPRYEFGAWFLAATITLVIGEASRRVLSIVRNRRDANINEVP